MKAGHWERLLNIGIYVAFLLLLSIAVMGKRNLHTDEVSTYVLSNNTQSSALVVNPVPGEVYIPAQKPWMDFMTVSEEGRFSYANVWQKQASDVHPPLYYALVHTICSFFPNRYSIWFAASVNIVFGLLTLFMVRKLSRKIFGSSTTVFLTSVFFIISAGVLSAMTFLRMYIMAMFWVTFLSWLFIEAAERLSVKRCVLLFAASVLGALTHYYVILYLFFASLVYGIYLLWRHRWKETGLFAGTMALSGAAAVAVFPGMLAHIFGGYRGNESVQNLMQSSFLRIGSCYAIVDSQLFGGLFGLLLLVIFLGWAGIVIKKRRTTVQNPKSKALQPVYAEAVKYLLSGIPIAAYFLLVSKIAVYVTDRYFHPIYPVLIVWTVGVFCTVVEKWTTEKNKWPVFGICCLFLLILSAKEWRNNWFYLYRHSGSLLTYAESHADTDLVFVYAEKIEINPAFYEVRGYRSVTFYEGEDFLNSAGDALLFSGDLTVVLSNQYTREALIDALGEEVREKWEQGSIACERIGEHAFTSTYHIYTPDG